MARMVTLAVVVALALAAPAGAVTLVGPDGAPAASYQAIADASFVPTVPDRVPVVIGACRDEARGCASRAGWIMLDPPRIHHGQTARVLMHELGHLFDWATMTDAARLHFLAITRDTRPWEAGPMAPAERFAEAYSLCARHRTIHAVPQVTRYDYAPGPITHRRVCRLIRQAAAGVFGRPPA